MSGVTSILNLLSMLAIIVASAALIWTLVIQPWLIRTAPPIEDVAGGRIQPAHMMKVLGNGPVTVIEFADFLCPFCARHAQNALPAIKRDLIDPGRIRYVVVHYPLEDVHPGSERAAEAAECAASQGRFWEMHERLFNHRQGLTDFHLLQHSAALGLDQVRFEACMTGGEALPKVRADRGMGRELGVQGTPTFFVGVTGEDGSIELIKRIRGSVSAETIAKAVEAAEKL